MHASMLRALGELLSLRSRPTPQLGNLANKQDTVGRVSAARAAEGQSGGWGRRTSASKSWPWRVCISRHAGARLACHASHAVVWPGSLRAGVAIGPGGKTALWHPGAVLIYGLMDGGRPHAVV